jgi:16S rRNA (cytosine967-C5)-methyltransferase
MNMPRFDAARALAVSVLTDITEDGAYANIALRQAFSRSGTLDARDKAFVTEMVNETLRNLLLADHIIDAFSTTPTLRMKPFIRNLLRISVCQIRFMERVPPSAAVNEAVILAKTHGFTALSGFVNGVLRNIVRNPGKPVIRPDDAGTRFSYPAWLNKALTHWLGTDNTRLFCENSHRPPTTAIFANTVKITPEALTARLQEEGVTCEAGMFPECIRLRHTADVSALRAFKEGLFFVIDEGAVWAVKALSPKPGCQMLDLCAAPGGKSFAAACMMGNEGSIQAFDIHPHRVRLMDEAIRRLGLSCIKTKAQDAVSAAPEPADCVLLDAPCSGLGIIRRRPDIKFSRKPENITALAGIQRDLLHTAAACVKPGGKLLYCTCTVAREENINNINWFIHHFPFTVEAPFLKTGGPSAYITENNCLQLLPGPYNDGFFITRLVKNE